MNENHIKWMKTLAAAQSPNLREEDLSQCSTCGFCWRTGTDGTHSCSKTLLDYVKRLEDEIEYERTVLKLLAVGGFVSQVKIDQVRALLEKARPEKE